MPSFSLKYRIAAIIFALEAIMMAVVLSLTLDSYFSANAELSTKNEVVLTNILSDLGRVALFNAEYDEFQPYIEEIVTNPVVEKVMLLDHDSRVVVSSNVTDIGKISPPFNNMGTQQSTHYWRVEKIANSAGVLGKLAILFSHETLLNANQKATDLGIATALTGMIVIAIVGIMIGFLLTRRLDNLTQAASKIADGNFSASTSIRGEDELGILGSAFNQMARNVEKLIAELRDREKDLRSAHLDLEQRITERTAELAVARDEALAANHTKSMFLANMSHEFRTPLNAISGYSELIEEIARENGYHQILGDLENIQNAGNHLLGIVNNVLDLSKIEAGKMEFEIREFQISELINEVVASVNPLVQKNNNQLEIHFDDSVVSMCTDETKVSQVLINLIANAAKFTENGDITFSIKKHEQHNLVIFTIEDTGIGINPLQINDLFEEFTQADSSTTRKYGGTGLGLALSKRICELLGGQISVVSQLNKGTKFTICLPVKTTIKSNIHRDYRDAVDLHPDDNIPHAVGDKKYL
jgi:signal transduction histidine kinase